jgi:alpha-1,6-mannosyltransferase
MHLPAPPEHTMKHRHPAAIYTLGAMLVFGVAYLAVLSTRFEYGTDMLQRPIRTLVAVLILLGLLHLAAVYLVVGLKTTSIQLLIWILAIGLAARLLLMPTVPTLEDDYYRYLWDGGVTASGFNPYRYTPHDIRMLGTDAGIPQQLADLSQESGIIATRINHADLGTIYPPIAQAGFAIAHFIQPWSLLAWKSILLITDITVVGLLLLLLRHIGKPSALVLIYWWNPLILKEFYNSAHMDLLYLPPVLLAVWLTLRHQPVRTALALVCGVAVKIWPVILAPLLIQYMNTTPKHIAIALIAGTLLLVTLFLPVLPTTGLGERSGFVAYSDGWEMNDAVFMVFDKGIRTALSPSALTKEDLSRIVRAVVALSIIAWIGFLCRRPMQGPQDLMNRMALAAGFFFMVSPTQFPWYYLWILPFLVFAPRPSLLILTATLPLYYLKFYYAALDSVAFFHYRIVWIEFLPVLLLAAWELRQFRLRTRLEDSTHA